MCVADPASFFISGQDGSFPSDAGRRVFSHAVANGMLAVLSEATKSAAGASLLHIFNNKSEGDALQLQSEVQLAEKAVSLCWLDAAYLIPVVAIGLASG